MTDRNNATAAGRGRGPTLPPASRPGRSRRSIITTVLVIFGLSVLLLLRFGGFLLVARDPLPVRADVAIALHGSYEGSKARADEVIRLLQEGRVDFAMLSVGAVSSWGQWQPDVVRSYLDSKYAREVVDHILVCEVLADSTVEEAAALKVCLQDHDWSSLVIVTSNFHTRRTKWIWGNTLADVDPPYSFTVWGVSDGTYEAGEWWRRRRYAKTWLLEIAKLAWYPIESVFGSRA